MLYFLIIISWWELEQAELLCRENKGIEQIKLYEAVNFVECKNGKIFKVEIELRSE